MKQPKEWVTVPEAALLVNRKPRTIYEWVAKGHLATRYNDENVTEVLSKAVVRLEPQMRRGRPKGTTRGA